MYLHIKGKNMHSFIIDLMISMTEGHQVNIGDMTGANYSQWTPQK